MDTRERDKLVERLSPEKFLLTLWYIYGGIRHAGAGYWGSGNRYRGSGVRGNSNEGLNRTKLWPIWGRIWSSTRDIWGPEGSTGLVIVPDMADQE